MLLDVLRGGSFHWTNVLVSVVSSLIVIFLCLPFHEFAHAFIADKLGDRTAKYHGRLTLNPLAHIDYFGALLIILVGFGYAKAVPVNPYNFNRPKRDIALVSLAGPLSNIVMALVLLIITNIIYLFDITTVTYIIANVLYYAALINTSLAVFNLIPIPPLDGSKILMAVLPDRLYYSFQRYESYLHYALIALVVFRALDVPISYAVSGIMTGLQTVANLPFMLFI